jgi:hypothetical protein
MSAYTRITVSAEFDIPSGTIAYKQFAQALLHHMEQLEKGLGSDCSLEYLAVDQRTDTNLELVSR